MDIFPDWLLGTYGSGTGDGITVLYGYDVVVEVEEYLITVEGPTDVDIFVVEQDQPIVVAEENEITVTVREDCEGE